VVTLVNGSGWTWDPFSISKLFALSLISSFVFWKVLTLFREGWRFSHRFQYLVATIFFFGLLVPIAFAESPVSQQIYGVAGRNLGLLHYFYLLVIFLGASLVGSQQIFQKFTIGLILTGTFESLLGIAQSYGKDPLRLINPGRDLIGTLGNSNYYSSFLSFSIIALIFVLTEKPSLQMRFSLIILLVIQIYALLMSEATQGLLLVVFGIVALAVINAYNISKWLGRSVMSFSFLGGLTSILGILQKGPFSGFLYQESVSYRGDYWRAGFKMFRENFTTGVGLDSFGDFYREYRDFTAATRRTTGSFPNSAHNLLLDLASTGGFLLVVSYLAIVSFVAIVVIKKFRRHEVESRYYKLLVVIWLAFNFQTLISINVSSLAIWGWIISGLLVANQSVSNKIHDLRRDRQHAFGVRTISKFFILFIIFILPMIPILNRDIRLLESSKLGDVASVSRSVLLFPRDSEQLNAISEACNSIGLQDCAFHMATQAVKENKQSFRGWEILSRSSISTSGQRKFAETRLKVLDPFYRSFSKG
jgi:O-antigen ligase